MEYTFYGSVPSKKNGKEWVQRGSRRCLVSSRAYTQWEAAHKAALAAKFGKPKYDKFSIELTFTFANDRISDYDNALTSIQDCLKASGIIKDDRRQYMTTPPVLKVTENDPENPRVKLVLNHE